MRMTGTEKSVVVSILMIVAFSILATIGWGMNIYKLCTSDFEAPYKSEIVRGVGVAVAPVGWVVGYMTIDDEN